MPRIASNQALRGEARGLKFDRGFMGKSSSIRLLDITLSAVGLTLFSPVMLVAMFLVWWQDGFSPFYIANRVGRGGQPFRMVKLRSMIKNADRTGVASTSATDNRITGVGHFIRRFKLDEITQLWNVLKGDMSFVGPRPNVPQAVALYTAAERQLLDVRPGITDPASIIFSDEGEILRGATNPDLLYEQIIRPWKNRLALFYVEQGTVGMYLKLVVLTAVAIVSKSAALQGVIRILSAASADPTLIAVARRDAPLRPFPPPGATEIVSSLQ